MAFAAGKANNRMVFRRMLAQVFAQTEAILDDGLWKCRRLRVVYQVDDGGGEVLVFLRHRKQQELKLFVLEYGMSVQWRWTTRSCLKIYVLKQQSSDAADHRELKRCFPGTANSLGFP